MDKARAKALGLRVEQILKSSDLKSADNVEVQIKGGSFQNGQLIVKIALSEIGADGKAFDPRAQDFTMYASMFGLKPEWLGRTFKYGPRRYKIVGLNPNRPRYPVSVTRLPDGKPFKMPNEAINEQTLE